MPITLEDLRRYAIARSLFQPTTLGRAIRRLGFVQADPIRAPARAQDLILRHRVIGYRAGDLERRYAQLGIEEDFFVNYGFLPLANQRLMHPRAAGREWDAKRKRQATEVLEFVRVRGTAHPRDVDAEFAHGKQTNWFGGSSNASTQLLDEMHYRGLLRIARREGGTRVYSVRATLPVEVDGVTDVAARMSALVDIIVALYAPLPAPSLGLLLNFLRKGVPQWSGHRESALADAKRRLPQARVGGVDWYWPAGASPKARRWAADESVRLLAPFDPVVWDRRRFEIFWGWGYRFEAYTPAPKRKLGYYALPLLWREQVIGWGNLSVSSRRVRASFGYVNGRAPRDRAFRLGLEEELERMRTFLGLNDRLEGERARPGASSAARRLRE